MSDMEERRAAIGNFIIWVENALQIEAEGPPHGTDPNTGPCECDVCQTWATLVKTLNPEREVTRKAKAWDEFWTWMEWLDDEERLGMVNELRDTALEVDKYSNQYADVVTRMRTLIAANPDGVAKLKATSKAEVEVRNTEWKKKHGHL